MAVTTGEKVSALEAQMIETNRRLGKLEDSLGGLHTKLDIFKDDILKYYVPVTAFEEYKKLQEEKHKNIWLDRIITALITTIIVGLVGFFFRAFEL